MPEVRVKQLETGHELSADQEWAERFADGYEILRDEGGNPIPGRFRNGELIPPKYHVTVDEAAAAKVAGGAKPYLDRKKHELEVEVAKRNADRGDDAAQIVVDPPGNKAELSAALEKDDAAQGDQGDQQNPAGDSPAGQGPTTEEN